MDMISQHSINSFKRRLSAFESVTLKRRNVECCCNGGVSNQVWRTLIWEPQTNSQQNFTSDFFSRSLMEQFYSQCSKSPGYTPACEDNAISNNTLWQKINLYEQSTDNECAATTGEQRFASHQTIPTPKYTIMMTWGHRGALVALEKYVRSKSYTIKAQSTYIHQHPR